jgi:hypothetical protein
MAAQPPSSRTNSLGDGDPYWQRKPLEHIARSPSPALVLQLKVTVVPRATLVLCTPRAPVERLHLLFCFTEPELELPLRMS